MVFFNLGRFMPKEIKDIIRKTSKDSAAFKEDVFN